MAEDTRHTHGPGDEGLVVTKTQTRTKLKRPRRYKVLLHNDDYTPRDFVVLVLQHVFHMGESEATRIMVYVHQNGVGVIATYPYSVAETKVAEVAAHADKANFPLLCTMEPEGEPDHNDGSDSGPESNE